GPERRLGPRHGHRLKCLYEGLLCGIIGIRRVAEQAQREVVDGTAVTVEQRLKRRCIALPEAPAQLFIREAAVLHPSSEGVDMRKLPSIQAIWLCRILITAQPLEEKTTRFWHNHFATANYKVANPQAMYAQNALFRTNAIGNFRDLLYGVSRDPAMLRWLDS